MLRSCAEQLDERESGVCLLKLGERYQLCTRQEYAENIRSVLDMKRNVPLSSAAFEVLAVVAYNQPVTKAYVEQVRGVDCSGVISTLCQKGLVEEKGRLDLPGRPLLYGTTPEFLKCFCIESLSELPELPEREEKEQETERKRLRPLRFLPKNPHSLLRRSPRTARTSILMNLMSMPTSSKICMNDAEVLAWQLST